MSGFKGALAGEMANNAGEHGPARLSQARIGRKMKRQNGASDPSSQALQRTGGEDNCQMRLNST